jgi:hypothetical protein
VGEIRKGKRGKGKYLASEVLESCVMNGVELSYPIEKRESWEF